MGIIIKQSIRSSIISYLGVIIGYVNVLWLYPYYLSTEQVGLFRLIQSASMLLATFGQIGLSQSLVKFYPEFKKEKGFVPAILLGGSIGFFLLFGISIAFKDSIVSYFSQESALFIEYFQLTILLTFLVIQFQLLQAYSRSLLKIVAPTFFRDIGLRVGTSIFLVLYGIEIISFDQLVYSLLIVHGLAVAGMLLNFLFNKELQVSFNFSFLKNGQLKRIMNYGFFSLIGAGGTQIILLIDNIMISSYEGLSNNGIYTIAFFIGVVIEMPKRAISQISSALLSQSFNKNDMAAVSKLYKQTAINQLIIGSLLLIGIWANLTNLYSFIPNSEDYISGFNVVLFIGLGKLSDMAFGTNGEIIVMSKYFKFNVITVAILATLAIALNTYLIPIYGIEGAAMASLIAMFVFNLTKFVFVWVKFGIQPFNFSTLKMLGISAVALLLNHLIPSLASPIADIVVRSSAISLLFLGLTYGLKVSEEFNGLIKQSLLRLKLK